MRETSGVARGKLLTVIRECTGIQEDISGGAVDRRGWNRKMLYVLVSIT